MIKTVEHVWCHWPHDGSSSLLSTFRAPATRRAWTLRFNSPVHVAASSFLILVPVIMTSVGGERHTAKLKRWQQNGAGGHRLAECASSSAFIPVNVHSSGAAAARSEEQRDISEERSSASFAGPLAAHKCTWQCSLCMKTWPIRSTIQTSHGDRAVIWIIMVVQQSLLNSNYDTVCLNPHIIHITAKYFKIQLRESSYNSFYSKVRWDFLV